MSENLYRAPEAELGEHRSGPKEVKFALVRWIALPIAILLIWFIAKVLGMSMGSLLFASFEGNMRSDILFSLLFGFSAGLSAIAVLLTTYFLAPRHKRAAITVVYSLGAILCSTLIVAGLSSISSETKGRDMVASILVVAPTSSIVLGLVTLMLLRRRLRRIEGDLQSK